MHSRYLEGRVAERCVTAFRTGEAGDATVAGIRSERSYGNASTIRLVMSIAIDASCKISGSNDARLGQD